jgi:hypothetical protein
MYSIEIDWNASAQAWVVSKFQAVCPPALRSHPPAPGKDTLQTSLGMVLFSTSINALALRDEIID